MLVTKLLKPTLGAGTLLYSRGGFSELRNEQEGPVPIVVFLGNATVLAYFAIAKNLFKNIIKRPD